MSKIKVKLGNLNKPTMGHWADNTFYSI